MQIATIVPIERAEALHQGGGARLPQRVVWASHEHAEAAHPIARLRAGGEWPSYHRATNELDEIAPSHSITSSARETRRT
jgi:hypothetical protein